MSSARSSDALLPAGESCVRQFHGATPDQTGNLACDWPLRAGNPYPVIRIADEERFLVPRGMTVLTE